MKTFRSRATPFPSMTCGAGWRPSWGGIFGSRASPGGSSGQVQYNDGGSLGGATDFEFDAVDSQVHIPAGSNSKPGIAFATDDDTGMYRVTTNQLGFATSGSNRMTIQAGTTITNQVMQATQHRASVNGSAGSTAFGWTSDVNIGMFRPGADLLGFSAGTNEMIRLEGTKKDITFRNVGQIYARFNRHKIRFNTGFYTSLGEPGYKRAQSFTSSSPWVFTHNLGHSDIGYWLYGTNGVALTPTKVDVGDPNIAYFYFAEAKAGRAVLIA